MTKENILAIPSKNRLNDESIDLLAQAGIDIQIPGRQLTTEIELPDTGKFTVALLRPKDIFQMVKRGKISLGIVGSDTAEEYTVGGRRYLEEDITARELGIGKCRLALACAEDSDMQTLDDVIKSARLDRKKGEFISSTGLSIATSFPEITRRFLIGEMNRINQWPKPPLGLRFVELAGSVEAASAMGLADVISDLVETGASLKANRLREITTIFESQGILITKASNRPGQNRLVDAVQNRLSTVLNN